MIRVGVLLLMTCPAKIDVLNLVPSTEKCFSETVPLLPSALKSCTNASMSVPLAAEQTCLHIRFMMCMLWKTRTVVFFQITNISPHVLQMSQSSRLFSTLSVHTCLFVTDRMKHPPLICLHILHYLCLCPSTHPPPTPSVASGFLLLMMPSLPSVYLQSISSLLFRSSTLETLPVKQFLHPCVTRTFLNQPN